VRFSESVLEEMVSHMLRWISMARRPADHGRTTPAQKRCSITSVRKIRFLKINLPRLTDKRVRFQFVWEHCETATARQCP
jgi:hypothetical protein